MTKTILQKVFQKLNALAAKVFKKETYPYPPLFQEENEESLNVTTKKLRRI